MGNAIPLLSIVTVLGAAQGLFLALALLHTKTGNVRAHRILALFTFLFSIDLAEEFFYQSGFFEQFPQLLNILAPIDLLYGPLIFLYVRQLTSRSSGTTSYWHFLPVLVAVLLLMPFYLVDASQKLAFTEAIRTGEAIPDASSDPWLAYLGFKGFILASVIQLGGYLAWSVRRLILHAQSIRNEFSDIDRINLAWLRNLLLGLCCIFLIYLGDQFFPDLLGMNILGDLVTVIAVVLIYAMGYLGLRQPAIFTWQPGSPSVGERETNELESDKYRRSGLDQDTSLLFLEELTGYMQDNKPYLEGDLVLPQLAQRLGISANYLSQIINEQLDVNFYDFINGYRIEEAKRLIRDSGQGKTNILAIALDSGFNSKSAFYTAFKKATSMTPTEYRKTV